jgi:hypothetical protein
MACARECFIMLQLHRHRLAVALKDYLLQAIQPDRPEKLGEL